MSSLRYLKGTCSSEKDAHAASEDAALCSQDQKII